jgi:hypothetical protein
MLIMWIKARFGRTSSHTALFQDRFPVESSQENQTRQLGWSEVRAEMLAQGWINLDSGNMVLVEAVGVWQTEKGRISARYWIAASDTQVDLFPAEQFLYQDHFGADKYQEVMPLVVDRTQTLLGLS